MTPFWLKHMYSVLSAFTWRPMPLAACSRLCSRDSAWIGIFARNAMPSTYDVSAIVSTGYRLLVAFFIHIYWWLKFGVKNFLFKHMKTILCWILINLLTSRKSKLVYKAILNIVLHWAEFLMLIWTGEMKRVSAKDTIGQPRQKWWSKTLRGWNTKPRKLWRREIWF